MARRDERGVALISVLVVILILSLLGGLLLYLSGQEAGLSRVRYRGAQSLAIAEGGAWAARAALMALVNADPADASILLVDETTMRSWYEAQNPLRFLDYVRTDGQGYSVGAAPSDRWVAFQVNWSLPTGRRKLQFLDKGSGPPPDNLLAAYPSVANNPLGNGRFQAVVLLEALPKAPAEGWECPTPDPCFVQFSELTTSYAVHLRYRVEAAGQVDPQFRRKVRLGGEFSVELGNRSLAPYVILAHRFTLASGARVYFGHEESYDGPVHTNGQFWFWGFPKFGTPDTSSPCDPGRIQATRLTSTSTRAGFRRISGSGALETVLEANEWVEGGQRRAAPVLPDCTPTNYNDDADNPAANFTRGFDADPSTPDTIDPVTIAPSSYNQRAIAIGCAEQARYCVNDPDDPDNPANWSEMRWRQEIRRVVPELRDHSGEIPPGIYIPVRDETLNGRSDDEEPLAGGIYVQGNLRRLTVSNCPFGAPGYPYCPPSSGDLAYYRFEHENGQVVTVIVDRNGGRTTVENSDWDPETRENQPGRRTFRGVPKGFQGTTGHQHATIIYVRGNIGQDSSCSGSACTTYGLSGTLEEREQVTVTASGHVYISGHLRYERPPNPYDPRSNPLNLLGIFAPTGEIRVPRGTPDNLELHGVLMAGEIREGGFPGQFVVQGLCSRPRQGELRHLGGLIAQYVGVTGCADSSGRLTSGYSDHKVYDRRMDRGFAPPYFPTSTVPAIQAQNLAGVRPYWQEETP
jgi:hypothetical protein